MCPLIIRVGVPGSCFRASITAEGGLYAIGSRTMDRKCRCTDC